MSAIEDHPARRPGRGREEPHRLRARRGDRRSSTPASRSRATSISGSISSSRTSRICETARERAGGAAHARARGPRRRAAVPAARGPHPGGLGDAPDARSAPAEARRARPLARDRAQGGRAGRRRRRRSARSAPSSSGWRTRSRTRVAILLEAGGLRVLHTGDYKLDHTPVDGLRTDVGKLAEIGNRGVDLLLGDSTNAERPGVTGSERLVGEAFRQIIPVREGRILVASFASNVHRMQQAVDVAVETGRKVCVDRPLDAQEPQHRAQPRLPRGARRHVHPAARARGARAARGDDPLHGKPGRADVGADADRLPRPPHGDASSAATR